MDIGIAPPRRPSVGSRNWFPARNPELLSFYTDPLFIGRLSRFNTDSRCAAAAVLKVTDDLGQLYHGHVPTVGFVRIMPRSTDLMTVSLTLTPRSTRGKTVFFEWALEAKAVPPRFSRATVPAHARVGQAVPVSWSAAGEVAVDVEGCGLKGRHSCQGQGAFVLYPERAGFIVIRFAATDRYGSTVKTRVVEVSEVPPIISMNHRIAAGKPGTEAVFSWTITAAEKAWMEVRGRTLAVELDGGFAVGIGLDPEDFRLVAKGRGGTTAVKLSVIPRFTSGLD